jgi:1-hydroxycarotenoid 3,4-desaturase
MKPRRVAIIGAGVGGLAAAVLLCVRGFDVTVLERAAAPGGKMREVAAGGAKIDAGPTVFTMRRVFDAIFEDAGVSLSDRLNLLPAATLARHAWSENERLDLYADLERTVDAIGAFSGRDAALAYRAFCQRAGAIYGALRDTFIHAPRPATPVNLVARAGLRGLGDLARISPFATMWGALGEHFDDPRLRQLFGRYATYCGSSPFLAPATLMLVAHVERDGVWLVEGGMHRLAATLAELAREKGAVFHYGAEATRILLDGGAVAGVETKDGARFPADAVVMNGDFAALGAGLLGADVARARPAPSGAARSLSAVTFAMRAQTEGFPLAHHNVFFSSDYAGEFDDIFKRGRTPRMPTVYVCAQDRGGDETPTPRPNGERLLCLVNAPASDDLTSSELEQCEEAAFGLLTRCGLHIHRDSQATVVTTPKDFGRLFPATQGALYGPASHGWMASFTRPGSRTRIPGLYLAGGSTHPGPGVPMAALSGRLAAESVTADLASTRRFRRAATPGGTSMR